MTQSEPHPATESLPLGKLSKIFYVTSLPSTSCLPLCSNTRGWPQSVGTPGGVLGTFSDICGSVSPSGPRSPWKNRLLGCQMHQNSSLPATLGKNAASWARILVWIVWNRAGGNHGLEEQPLPRSPFPALLKAQARCQLHGPPSVRPPACVQCGRGTGTQCQFFCMKTCHRVLRAPGRGGSHSRTPRPSKDAGKPEAR